MHVTEVARLQVQKSIDNSKDQLERNRLGQFATRTALAEEMLTYAAQLLPTSTHVSFLDPAFGTGAFYSALLKTFPLSRIERAKGFEIDARYGNAAKNLWNSMSLDMEIADFTLAEPPKDEMSRFNLLICNPPYVRHHHLQLKDKLRLQGTVEHSAGVKLSGLSGLYCYFLCLSQSWMAPDGLAGWLIPSEFMDVNYGRGVKQYLLDQVTLLRIHRFDPANSQFKDAYVSSAIVFLRNSRPIAGADVEFTYGGTLLSPMVSQFVSAKQLRTTSKWTTYPLTSERSLPPSSIQLSELFEVKRGLATGDNNFFIMSVEDAQKRGLPSEFLRPILPPPRELDVELVEADETGDPLIERKLVLLDCPLSEDTIRERFPALWAYLQEGKRARINDRYLCQHRVPWYSQENRPAAPLLCTYLGRKNTRRGQPFRFVLNLSKATATNVWLMLYPKSKIARKLKDNAPLLEAIWKTLCEISPAQLLANGRVYGGGLYKLEPSELGNVPAELIATLLNEAHTKLTL